MWRLFPKSWFALRDPAARAQSAATEALYTHWKTWLGASMTRVLKEDVTAGCAPRRLRSLTSSQLVALDQVLRYGVWETTRTRPARGTVPLTPIGGSRADIEAYLFTSTCDANGFIREQALVAFMQFPGRLALAAALIRCADWVSEVQHAGKALLQSLIISGEGMGLLKLIDLLLILRQRSRLTEYVWPSLLEPELLHPRHSAARWQASRTGLGAARLFAYALIVRAEPDRIREARNQAIQDADPSVARWSLSPEHAALSRQDTLALLDVALQHRHSSVRAEALRQSVAIDPQNAKTLLEPVLFDRAQSPRRVAAFLLRRDFQIDPTDYWRRALATSPTARACIALLAMADAATIDDVELVLPWLAYPKSAYRMAALRALAHAGAPALPHYLENALGDISPRTVKQAVQIYANEQGGLNPDILGAAYATATSDSIRRVLVRAVELLDKWNGLELLLRWSAVASDAFFDNILARALSRWTQSELSRFTRLPENAKNKIQDALIAASLRHADYRWQSIEISLKHG